ncbi:unnamed protein product [Phytophthora lilii]|uniref:Unnamed protein product n=1 Tax=Phytophthora lilii TaxID=2077276 RepID=A0A9W6X5H6_9STRA|nr:unnamed protein product [Phytophthora lilii]
MPRVGSDARFFVQVGRAAQRLGIAVRIEAQARVEMQEVARDRIHEIRHEESCSVFRVTPPNRDDIAAWVCLSWNKLTTTTIIGGFSRVGVLGDTHVADFDTERSEAIVEELAEELRCLGALGKPVHSEHDIRSDSDEN